MNSGPKFLSTYLLQKSPMQCMIKLSVCALLFLHDNPLAESELGLVRPFRAEWIHDLQNSCK